MGGQEEMSDDSYSQGYTHGLKDAEGELYNDAFDEGYNRGYIEGQRVLIRLLSMSFEQVQEEIEDDGIVPEEGVTMFLKGDPSVDPEDS